MTITYEASALEFVNAIRERYHLEPLDALRPGYKDKCDMCVITESLRECSAINEVRTTPNYVRIVHQEWDPNAPRVVKPIDEQIPTGAIVKEFINQFDRGEYPHLVKGK